MRAWLRVVKAAGVLVLLLVTPPSFAADEPADFTTDGCSLFPDGSPVTPKLWCDCCVNHDMAYWRGGTEEQRKQSDEALKACVAERTGNAGFAEMVYAGVRAGGLPIYPMWYRWAYGWKYGRGYAPLSEAEQALADRKLEAWRNAHPDLSCAAQQVREKNAPAASPD